MPDASNKSRDIYVATIIDAPNYGTVMQATATREILGQYGHPVFVDYCRPEFTKDGRKLAYRKQPGNIVKKGLRYIATTPSWDRNRAMFRRYVERELELCDPQPFTNGGRFDPDAVYCVGSDQTWNFEYNNGLNPVYFLTNVPDACRKIAFSASFGRPSLSADEQKLTRPALERFDAISVRETSSLGILEEMGLHGVALKDPVLLCRTGLWQELSQTVPTATKPFILVYMLNSNPLMIKYADHLAEALGCEVKVITFHIKGALLYGRGHVNVYQPEPEEWLALFRDARYVVTDSFHGTCFSLLFEKPMTVFDPPKYSVRLIDVLNDFGLSERRIAKGEEGDPRTVRIHQTGIDWERIRQLKTRFAAEAHSYLDSSLGSID